MDGIFTEEPPEAMRVREIWEEPIQLSDGHDSLMNSITMDPKRSGSVPDVLYSLGSIWIGWNSSL